MPIRKLPPDLQKIVERDFQETPQKIKENIGYIREWLSKQPHLPSNIEDQWILSFLRGCKYSLERTKEKLDFYYTTRSALPEMFKNRDPMSPDLQEVMKLGMVIPLRKPDKAGSSVFLVRNGVYSPHKHDINKLMKIHYMIVDLELRDSDRVPIAGDVSIVDLKNVTFAHAAQMSPPVANKIMTVFREAYPLRPKSLNYYNIPGGLDAAFSLFKSFMKKKLQDRVHMHGNKESLFKVIPQEILPEEYGGEAGTCQQLAADIKRRLEENRDWFLEQEKICSDESRRHGKPKTQNELFGVEGSFRKLEVD